MKYKVLKKTGFKTSAWQGGTTTELAIYPYDSSYKRRDFIFRLSSATVDDDESVFTDLPDYNRWLMVLDGEAVLTYNGERTKKLSPFMWDAFDGADKTVSFGKITDYNLMVKKGCEGELYAADLSDKKVPVKAEKKVGFRYTFMGIFISGEYAVVNLNDRSVIVRDGEQLTVYIDEDESPEIGIMGNGKAVITAVYHNEEYREGCDSNEGVTAETEPDQGAGIEGTDFALAFRLYINSFRFSKYISGFLKNHWFDRELRESLDRINRLFLTFIIFMAGIALSMFAGIKTGMPAIVLLWAALDILLINPLVYMMWLPKPIASHIKKREDMNAADALIDKEMDDEHISRMMKRYRTADDWIEGRKNKIK